MTIVKEKLDIKIIRKRKAALVDKLCDDRLYS